jgi:UDP-N-acetylmuramate--alanine ligase
VSLVAPVEVVPVAELGRVHMVGIGGAGMSGIARVLLARGVAVSGSDAKESALLAELRGLGARTTIGHAAANLADLGPSDTLVVSTAIRTDNPELVEARRRGMRVLPRASALASLMADRRGVAVAGTHGKTTTTSMLTVAAQHAGAQPGYVIGGQLVTSGVGAEDGAGELFVVEADESDGSFLMLHPAGAIVTNIEADHLDNYTGLDEILAGFAAFVDGIRPGGFLVVCADDANAAALAPRGRERGLTVLTYGTAPSADIRVTAITSRGLGTGFTIDGLGAYTLTLPGKHNALNAAAVVAACRALGLDDDSVRAGLAAFGGAARRFEAKGEAGGVAVFDSYAHHPTELTADLEAARDLAADRGGRVIAVFQPHLFSRTRIFADQFGAALGLADHAVVLDVYAAREDPEPGITGATIAERVPGGRVTYQPDRAAVPATVAGLARAGDVVLTMGAGDITQLGPVIVASVREKAEE